MKTQNHNVFGCGCPGANVLGYHLPACPIDNKLLLRVCRTDDCEKLCSFSNRFCDDHTNADAELGAKAR